MAELIFRSANLTDLGTIVEMLADDYLGAKRERLEYPLPSEYNRAFKAINADPNIELVVACLDGVVVGMLQLTFIPGLSRVGAWRALIESVRVAGKHRSTGIGTKLLQEAIEMARERGYHMIQLTTDKSRTEAKRFYESLGFIASHEGMKLILR
jgi:ribosomal protein S18 acetylase RimI-like enzyme